MPSVHIKVEDGVPLAASLEIPRRYTPHTQARSQTPVHVKAEEDASPPAGSPVTPRRYPSFSAFTEKWSQSPLRVPTPLAEEFYRSTMVEAESEQALVRKKELPPLCHDCERSAGLTDTKKPSTKASRDLASPQRVSAIKAEGKSPVEYYIPTRTYKVEPARPSALTKIAQPISDVTDSSRLYHEARIPGRSTVTSPVPRPDTEFSYNLPVTPTPFGTPNALVNPYNRPAQHCVPGSLLEGMRRRTKWGNRQIRDNADDKDRRARQAKQEKRAKQHKKTEREGPVIQSGSVPPVENDAENDAVDHHEISQGAAKNPEHGTTCAWYKIPFCKCCVCIMVVGTRLVRNIFVPSLVAVPRPCRTTSMVPTPNGWARRKKWWHLQSCKELPQDIDEAKRDEFHHSGRRVVLREI